MTEALDAVQQPEPRPGSVRHPAAARVSAEAFLQAACIAWGRLQPAERKVIRACCRAGRLQHDRLLCDLRLTLGSGPALQQGNREPSTTMQATPQQIKASLHAAMGRGARLQSLSVRVKEGADGHREAQLLAALEAFSRCPSLTRLELRGAVPHSGATAGAVEACCPRLTHLVLDHPKDSPTPELQGDVQTAAVYHLGCVQLLTLCGPRLTELRLLGVQRWQPSSYMALGRCTALTSLTLEAGFRRPNEYADEDEVHTESPGVEACVYGAVAQLRTLRSLHLVTNVPTDTCSLDAVRPFATRVAHLSTLSSLTHLELVMSRCYDHTGDSCIWQQEEEEEHRDWCAVRSEHRAALLSALRCMPHLCNLSIPTMRLQLSELAALSAVTSLNLAGLLPPEAGAGRRLGTPPAVSSSPTTSCGALLPAQLQELVLCQGASPRALAALQPLPSLARLDVELVRFGVSDVTEDGRVRAETVQAVGRAVQLLVAHSGGTPGSRRLVIEADGYGGPMRPCEGAPDGHIAWIRQLQGLGLSSLELFGMVMRAGDLSCLAQSAPGLQELVLNGCSLSLAALPALRPGMRRLRRLTLHARNCADVQGSVLKTVLLLLCRPHGSTAPLEEVQFLDCPPHVDVQGCVRSVQEQLESDFGVRGVKVMVT